MAHPYPTLAKYVEPGFQHEPLPDARVQIRLLYFSRHQGNDEVNLTIHNYTLQDAPEFRAISYAWGEQTDTKWVVISGRRMLVHQTCWSALRQVRHHHPDDVFWIDAICINQNDLDEKGQQVGFMGQIYATAVSVLICLGPHSCDSELLFYDWGDDADATESNTAERNPAVSFLSSRLEGDSVQRFKNLLNAYHSLENRSYWTRAWVIQEFALAKSVYVLCGNGIMLWKHLRTFWSLAYTKQTQKVPWIAYPRLPTTDIRPRNDVLTRFDSLEGSRMHARNLEELLLLHYNAGCTDPRDRIFALLSLVKQGKVSQQKKSLVPNYRASRLQLAYDVATCVHPLTLPLIQYTLLALEIDFSHPRIRGMVIDRQREDFRDDGMSPKESTLFRYSPFRLSLTMAHDLTTRLRRIQIDQFDRLTAFLMESPKDMKISAELTNFELGMIEWCKGEPGTTSLYKWQKLFVKSKPAAILCEEARDGDFLVEIGRARGTERMCLVLRRRSKNTFKIMGQGIILRDFWMFDWGFSGTLENCIRCAVDDFHSRYIEFLLTPEDAIVLVGQDLVSLTTRDLLQWVQRLNTKVTKHGYVYVYDSPCDNCKGGNAGESE